MSPTLAIGDGRTYASAARKPGEFVNSGGLSVCCEDIEGVFSFDFRFPGFTVDWLEKSFLVVGPALSKVVEESLVGVGGRGDNGSGRSSREKIDKSSPFH